MTMRSLGLIHIPYCAIGLLLTNGAAWACRYPTIGRRSPATAPVMPRGCQANHRTRTPFHRKDRWYRLLCRETLIQHIRRLGKAHSCLLALGAKIVGIGRILASI